MKQLTICLLFVLVIASCRNDDCEDAQDTYTPFLQEDLDAFPYSGNETLTFKRSDSSGKIIDTIILQGQGLNIIKNVPGGDDRVGDCGVTHHYDKFDVLFKAQADSNDLLLSSTTSTGSALLAFIFREKSMDINLYYFNAGPCYSADTSFNGTIYRKVRRISASDCSLYYTQNAENVFFMNKYNGIMRVEMDNEIWDLIPF